MGEVVAFPAVRIVRQAPQPATGIIYVQHYGNRWRVLCQTCEGTALIGLRDSCAEAMAFARSEASRRGAFLDGDDGGFAA